MKIVEKIKKLNLSLEDWQKEILLDVYYQCKEEKSLAPLMASVIIDFDYELTKNDIKWAKELEQNTDIRNN